MRSVAGVTTFEEAGWDVSLFAFHFDEEPLLFDSEDRDFCVDSEGKFVVTSSVEWVQRSHGASN